MRVKILLCRHMFQSDNISASDWFPIKKIIVMCTGKDHQANVSCSSPPRALLSRFRLDQPVGIAIFFGIGTSYRLLSATAAILYLVGMQSYIIVHVH